MIDQRMLTFISQIHFPKAMYFGARADGFLKTVETAKKLFIVSRSWSKQNREIFEKLSTGSTVVYHSGEPTVTDFDSIKKKVEKNHFDFILGLGGGSVIDLAKAVKKDAQTPMIAIPTTIGSGAEVSRFSVLVDTETKSKKILNDPQLLPETIIFNSQYLQTLSPNQIISQSLDALAHALEALVSRMSNYLSDLISLAALESIYQHLDDFAEAKTSPRYLEELKIATTLAGLAQSSAATGLAHSFAHVLGPRLKLQHAQAVAMFLIATVELNLAHTQNYQKLDSLKNLSQATILKNLNKLYDKLEFKPRAINLDEDLNVLVQKIRSDVCTLSNPYSPTLDDITFILKKYI